MADSPSRRSTPRGGRPAAGSELSLDDVARAAVDVVAEVGVDGMTRALVADRLGVSSRALYRLAPTSEALLICAIGEWQRRWFPPDDTGDWVDDLQRWAEATLDHMSRHRGLVVASMQVEAPEEPVRHVMEGGIDLIVRRAGVDPTAAAEFFSLLGMHCIGWHVVFPPDRPTPADPGADAHVDFRRRGFRRGLDLLLRGFAAEVADST
ncbi:MAG: hypothetical protein AAGF02_03130 [Actinomycetota bacterium]